MTISVAIVIIIFTFFDLSNGNANTIFFAQGPTIHISINSAIMNPINSSNAIS